LQRMIGLVAIDECHLIKQWQDFRDKFTMLGELRLILRDHVVWFGCTATLDAIAEQLVLKNAGFRTIGTNSYQTEVVRTSIDRLDLSISVCPIPRKQLASYDPLYFLLDEAIHIKDGSANEVVIEKTSKIAGVDGVDGAEALVDSTIMTCTPDLIPKTIIFVDSHTKIAGMAQFLRTALVAKTASFPPGQKYVAGGDNPTLDVFNIVQTFTSHVSIHDQDKRYREFLKSDAKIRIMVATTTLGTGVNVHDVARIINWQFPLGMDLSEIWQRVGRGGRGDGTTSKAYVFLPFWAFDDQGRDKPGQEDAASQPTRKKPKAKRQRNLLPSDKAIRRQSALQISWTADEFNDVDSDVESECSISSQVSQAIASQASGAVDEGPSTSATVERTGLPYWSKKEREQRSRLPEWWKRLCNDDCKREPILDYLDEKKLSHQAERITRDRCCNGCNPALNPILTKPPTTVGPPKEPTKGSRAAVALSFNR
jgi:superfamily II DNA helicase RecQ